MIIKYLLGAFKNSIDGLKAVIKTEIAVRLELLLCVIFIPLAFWVGGTAVERILLICSVLLILIIELVNSAIETTVDRISKDHHELSGRAKDIGSAAVLIAIINALVVWGLIIF